MILDDKNGQQRNLKAEAVPLRFVASSWQTTSYTALSMTGRQTFPMDKVVPKRMPTRLNSPIQGIHAHEDRALAGMESNGCRDDRGDDPSETVIGRRNTPRDRGRHNTPATTTLAISFGPLGQL